MKCLNSVVLELLSIRSDRCRLVEEFRHILRAFDVRCELRNCRGLEILLRRALSTWKALVDAVNGDADVYDEYWTTIYIETALILFNYLTNRSVTLL